MNASTQKFYTINTRECLFVIIQGDSIASLDDLFEVMAGGMEFPDYFGHNMDALFDMLTDLSWIPQDEIRIVITHAEAFFSTIPEVQFLLKELFTDARQNQMENKLLQLYYADLHDM